LGEHTLASVDLCAMGGRAEDGFYHVLSSLALTGGEPV